MRFERVRGPPGGELEAEQMYALSVAPSDASAILEHLNVHHPLPPHLSHVKRIWRRQQAGADGPSLSVLLTPVPRRHHGGVVTAGGEGSNGSDGEAMEGNEEAMESNGDRMRLLLPPLLRSRYEGPGLPVSVAAKVPSRMPRDRAEYDRWRALEYWPTAFHEQKAILREEAAELALVTAIGTAVMGDVLGAAPVVIVDPARWTPAADPAACTVARADTRGGGHVLDEAVMVAIAAVAAQQRSAPEGDDSRPYLCTGYMAFCREEPSLMAAMALVHARIRAVVFAHADGARGGLCSRARLQDVSGTNHHFSVYRCSSL